MTYSVYNIKIDNGLYFNPGPTAGNVLAINSDGSTSWVQGGSGGGGSAGSSGTSGTSGSSGVNGATGSAGGSQTLEQTLALGNSTGTYSILAGTAGTASNPMYSFASKPDMGIFQGSPNGLFPNLSFATGGKTRFNVDDYGIYFNGVNMRPYYTSDYDAIPAGGAGSVIIGQYLATDATGYICGTSSPSSTGSFGITIDGGGSAITTGVKGYIQVPYSGTITGWTLLSDISGSIVIDVWKDTFATFPPSVADTIAGSEKPTLSSSQKNEDNSLSTWTTSITAGDIIAFNVDSASTLTRVNLAINITKS